MTPIECANYQFWGVMFMAAFCVETLVIVGMWLHIRQLNRSRAASEGKR